MGDETIPIRYPGSPGTRPSALFYRDIAWLRANSMRTPLAYYLMSATRLPRPQELVTAQQNRPRRWTFRPHRETITRELTISPRSL